MPTWEIRLPERRRGGIGSGRPRAEMLLGPEGSATVHEIPVVVARRLLKRLEDPDCEPSAVAQAEREIEGTCCSEKAEALLNLRDFSSKELRDRLLREGYRQSIVEDYVSKAVDSGLVDDRRYAEVFIRSKLSAGWGERKISNELHRRGIEADELEGWPYEYFDPDDERARARDIASRRSFSEKNRRAKIVRFLTGRGFSIGVAYDVARDLTEGEGN